MRSLMVLLTVLAMAPGIYGACNWSDSGSDHLWSNPDNWTLDSTHRPPLHSDTTFIRYADMVEGGQGPVIQDGINAAVRNLSVEVGSGDLIELTMTGGTLTIYSPGATNCYFRLGGGTSSGKAVFNMSGGVLRVDQDNGADGYLRVGYGYTAEMYMSNDATVYALSLLIAGDTDSFVDLRDNAQIILKGDHRTAVEDRINGGRLTAWGGSGTVLVDYDVTNPGFTTIRSVPGIVSPGMGETVIVGNVELNWTNYEPNMPGDDVYVDVWFGTDPNKLNPATYTKVVSLGKNLTSTVVSAPVEGTYYWQVDSYIYGTTEPASVTEGFVYVFHAAEDLPPSVDAGPDMITWAGQPIQLNAIIQDDGASATTILWEANDPNAVLSDPAIENPFVTVDYPAGAVTLTATVQDGTNLPVSNAMVLHVYANPCEAARLGLKLSAANPEDLTGDCIVDLNDFAVIASQWLEDYALTAPVPVP